MKANIIMVDESELKEVYIFRNKELGDSIVSTKEEIELLLNFDSDKTIYFSGNYIQGGLIPKRIQEYEIIDNEKELSIKLLDYVKKHQDIYDININDVVSFILDNRQNLLKILR